MIKKFSQHSGIYFQVYFEDREKQKLYKAGKDLTLLELLKHERLVENAYVQISKLFEGEIINIILPIHFIMCFGCSKEPIETILSCTHNICFEYSFQLHTLIWRPNIVLVHNNDIIIKRIQILTYSMLSQKITEAYM